MAPVLFLGNEMWFRILAVFVSFAGVAGCTVNPNDLPGSYLSSEDRSKLVVRDDGTATVTKDDAVRQYQWRIHERANACTRLEFMEAGGAGFLPCAHWSIDGGAVISHGADEYYIKSKD
ncbi:hypothetical protein [Asticcacaulis sp. AC402]|uniref:hypothetical protein n=1 Tax=Asticcacaulis sp. AC402 TaxID=1282361 RepID=UPI0003C3E7F0|nr:hypothetical protein [Asticcacaulis sp. AC402]ESQ75861.1 hypothetical protein ABAC402_07810 [Asticcacaulis sp. AC402]